MGQGDGHSRTIDEAESEAEFWPGERGLMPVRMCQVKGPGYCAMRGDAGGDVLCRFGRGARCGCGVLPVPCVGCALPVCRGRKLLNTTVVW